MDSTFFPGAGAGASADVEVDDFFLFTDPLFPGGCDGDIIGARLETWWWRWWDCDIGDGDGDGEGEGDGDEILPSLPRECCIVDES